MLKYILFLSLLLNYFELSSSIPTCEILENTPPLTTVCNLQKIIPSSPGSLQLDNFQSLFRIDNDVLLLSLSLDRERLISQKRCQPSRTSMTSSSFTDYDQCQLTLELSSPGPTFHQLGVIIADDNDNIPKFDRMTFIVSIPENSPANREIDLPQANDPDRGNNGSIKYELMNSKNSHRFLLVNANPHQMMSNSIRSNSRNNLPLKLKFLQSFDREVEDQIKLILIATDLGQPIQLSSSMTIQIDILDVNDHPPMFNSSSYRFTVSESLNQGQPIGQVFATDQDISNRLTIEMSPSANSEISDTFSISSDGVITSKIGRLDFTSPTHEYIIPIIAVDGGIPPYSATTTAYVRVKDVNNHSPVIDITPPPDNRNSNLLHKFSIPENCPPNTYVAKVTVTDADYGINAQIECKLESTSYFNLHPIKRFDNRRYYKLTTGPTYIDFDREKNEHHQVRIICKDMGEPQARTSTRDLLIRVRDVNDNGPEFDKAFLAVKIAENEPIDTILTRLRAMDKDQGDNAITRYRLVQSTNDLTNVVNTLDYFKIDPITGIITIKQLIDRELIDRFVLHVTAYDQKIPKLHSNITIQVTIIDRNDNAPKFENDIKFHIKENQAGIVGNVEATDADIGVNGKVEYMLTMYNNVFQISRSGQIKIHNNAKIDREKKASYLLEIAAEDRGRPKKRTTTTVEIIVDDINDNKPIFVHPARGEFCNISFDTLPRTKVYQIVANDADIGENGRVIYSILRIIPRSNDALFSINQTDGSIYLEVALPREPLTRPNAIVIVANDNGSPFALTSTTTLHIRYRSHQSINYPYNPDLDASNPNYHNPNNPGTNNQNYPKIFPNEPGYTGDNTDPLTQNGIGKSRSNSDRSGSSSRNSRDLVLSVGIGMVLLIFIFLLLLVAYFCVSVMLQRQKQRRRAFIEGKSTNEMLPRNNQEHNPDNQTDNNSIPRQWWTSMWSQDGASGTRSNWCCMPTRGDNVSMTNTNAYGNITANSMNNFSSNNHGSSTIHRTMSSRDNNTFPLGCDPNQLQLWNQQQRTMTSPMTLHPIRITNSWQHHHSESAPPTAYLDNDGQNNDEIDCGDDSHYTYRHFTMNKSQHHHPHHLSSSSPPQNNSSSTYWSPTNIGMSTQYYHTLQQHQSHQQPTQVIFARQPDIIGPGGESNSSDEVNRIFYGGKTPTIMPVSAVMNSTRSPLLATHNDQDEDQQHQQEQEQEQNQNEELSDTNTQQKLPTTSSHYQTGTTPRIVANSFV